MPEKIAACEGCPDADEKGYAVRTCVMRDPISNEVLLVSYCLECRLALLYEPVDLEVLFIPTFDILSELN